MKNFRIEYSSKIDPNPKIRIIYAESEKDALIKCIDLYIDKEWAQYLKESKFDLAAIEHSIWINDYIIKVE